jgi:uncharacterized protein YpiB (UPF0302 family)
MAYTYEELKTMTVAQLREIAAGSEHEALKGYTQLHKDQLLAAICHAFGVDMHEHHEAKGINKTDIKVKIKELKKRRDAALEAHDHAGLKDLRRKLHRMKRMIHKATV